MRGCGLSRGLHAAEEEECDVGTEGHHLQTVHTIGPPSSSVSVLFPKDF